MSGIGVVGTSLSSRAAIVFSGRRCPSVRGRTDLVIVAELLGHARLETTRAYSRPTRQDAIDALELLDVDH